MAAAFWPGPIAARGRELLGGPDAAELGFERVLGWTDIRADGPPLQLLVKGDIHRAGPAVQFRPPTAVKFSDREHHSTDTSGASPQTRLELANWIADPRNPLTTRVIVNRIWQFSFGVGIVRSMNNFGFRGDPPSHPELLDFLAAELVQHDWQLKSIHRLLLSSDTFAQASEHALQSDYAQRDAANQWHWRHNRRRLDAEGLRDAILQSSDELDLRLGGAGFLPELSTEAWEGLSRKNAA